MREDALHSRMIGKPGERVWLHIDSKGTALSRHVILKSSAPGAMLQSEPVQQIGCQGAGAPYRVASTSTSEPKSGGDVRI